MEQLSNMDPLTIALVLLVVAGFWAVIELALFLRRTRKGIADVTDSVSETIAELRPTMAKLDGITDELGSASKQLEPILEKASTTVDLVNVNLVRTESVLSDVNTVTNTAGRASVAVTGAAGNAASAVAGVVNKVAGKVSGKATNDKLEAPSVGEPARLSSEGSVSVEHVKGDEGYFTYPGAASEATAAEPEQQAAPAIEVEELDEAAMKPEATESSATDSLISSAVSELNATKSEEEQE